MKIVIIGRSEILYNVMEMVHSLGHKICLIITSKEAPEYSISAADFQAFAKGIGSPFLSSPTVNEGQIFATIEETEEMDLAISINYTSIISQTVIDVFKIGILNMHAGDLPRYRGNAVVSWAMLNGETQIVNCIHRMIGGELDSGDILLKDRFPLGENTKIGEVFEWLGSRAPQLFKEVLERLTKNPNYVLERQSKNPMDSLRCYPRRSEDGRINWAKNAEEIHTHIRSSSEPFQGAFAFFLNEKIVVWSSLIERDEEQFLATPGQITKIDHGDVVVATAEGKIRITEIGKGGVRMKPGKLITSLRGRFK